MPDKFGWRDWLYLSLTMLGLILSALGLAYGYWILAGMAIVGLAVVVYFGIIPPRHRGYSITVLHSHIVLTFKEPSGKYVDYRRDHEIRPNAPNLTELVEELVFVESTITNVAASISGMSSTVTQAGTRGRPSIRQQFASPLQKGHIYSRVLTYEMVDCFASPTEFYEINVCYPTKQVRLELVFPEGREPRNLRVFIPDARGHIDLPVAPLQRHQNRCHYIHIFDKPRLGYAYRVTWDW